MKPNRSQKIHDVRMALNWLEMHPEIPLPAIDKLVIYSWDSKEEAQVMAGAMGTCTKSADEHFFRLSKRFGSVVVEAVFSRGQVCERVVVGTKEVITETADPALVAALPKVKTSEMVEIVEWKCPELLNGEANHA